MAVRISIALPVWNDVAWLPGAIESVLAQDHQDWELVIGDNVSEEDVPAVLEKYSDARIRYHRWDVHTDAYENFNRTSQLSKFEWVQPISADDRLEPTCLSKIAGRVSSESEHNGRLAIVMTDCFRVDENGKQADLAYFGHQRLVPLADGTYEAGEWLDLMSRPSIAPWNIGSIAFSRDILMESGWLRPDVGYGADLELVLRMAAYGKISYIDEKLLHYTVRSSSDSMSRVLRIIERGEPATPMESAWRSALQAHRMGEAIPHSRMARINEAIARSHLQRALQHRLWPGGHGRKGAFDDIRRGFWLSPRLLYSTRHVGEALLALLGPRWAIEWTIRRLTASRRGSVSSVARAPR